MKSEATLQRVLKYIYPHKMQVITATIFTILNKIFDILPDTVIGVAVDVVVNQGNSFLAHIGITSLEYQLYFLAFLVIITWFGESITQYAMEFSWGTLAYILQHALRVDAYVKAQMLPMEFFEYTDSSDIASILSEDINDMEEFIQQGIMEIIKMIAGVILMGAIILYLSPFIALFTILPIPFIFIIMYIFQKKLAKLYAQEREAASETNSRLISNISGIRSIKSYITGTFEASSINRFSQDYQNKNIAALSVSSAVIPVVRIIIAIGFIATLIIGGKQVVNGTLNIGAYTVLIALVQQLLWPFTEVAQMAYQFEQDMACAGRVFEIIDASVEKCAIETKKIPLLTGAISFAHVAFSYPNGKTVFTDFTVHIPAGKTVAFVGETGAGKSTIIKLLLRLYEVSGGTILLDNIPINSLSCASLRKQIALVSQEPFIFEGTIAENISYGTFNATYEQIVCAAKYAEIDEFIETLPKKYDTHIAYGAPTLSSGQKQRIALARALLKDAPIFIFDEATAILDTETELEIQKSLEKVSPDHTTIIIAHRLSTVRQADVIYVLDKGKIIESGTHEQLLAKQGEYATLWNIQIGK